MKWTISLHIAVLRIYRICLVAEGYMRKMDRQIFLIKSSQKSNIKNGILDIIIWIVT